MTKPLAIRGLVVQFMKQGRHVVAYSPALDLSTSGKNTPEARKRFTEAVVIFFDELAEAGTTDEVLTELGWTKRPRASWQPPQVRTDSINVRVPVGV